MWTVCGSWVTRFGKFSFILGFSKNFCIYIFSMFNTGKLNGSTLEDYMPNVCTESPLKGRLYLKHDNETWCFRKFVKIYFLVSIFLFFQIVILKLSFSGSAFCKHHCSIVEQLGYKTGLREFLKSCSDKETDVNPNLYCKKMKSRVNSVLDEIARACKSDKSNSATDAQGRPHFMPYLSFWSDYFHFCWYTLFCHSISMSWV